MSIKVQIYAPFVGKELVAKTAARFSDFGMECEFDPEFAFELTPDAKWLSMRLQGQETQFEIAGKQYRYASPLSTRPAINEKLKTCTHVLTLRMHATPPNAFRAGMYFATFLAELTDGVVYSPRSDQYIDSQEALMELPRQVRDYEAQ